MARERVVVAMSGGVDSTMVAVLLKEAGYDVIGINLHLWCEDNIGHPDRQNCCCTREDARDAEWICHQLGTPFYILNLESEFQSYVIDYFYREYSLGRTPNPCIACNEYIKFGFLLHRALALGAEYLATGHYARIISSPDGYHLLKAVDPAKDQSYFLYTLGQKELKNLLFPLGNYSKVEVRQQAAQRGLLVASKPDSQEVCFIRNGNYHSVWRERFPDMTRDYRTDCTSLSSGDIMDTEGRVIGQHHGLVAYTIGQRKGLGLATGERLYVTKIDAQRNTLTVGREDELLCSHLVATKLRWILEPPEESLDITAKIRYKSTAAPVTLHASKDSVGVQFHQPQRAITPGQAVVFYHDDEVLGGGVIGTPSAA